MLPLNKQGIIKECKSKGETKRFLESHGLIPGVPIAVISEIEGNLIVSVKGAKIALNKGIAQQLLVQI